MHRRVSRTCDPAAVGNGNRRVRGRRAALRRPPSWIWGHRQFGKLRTPKRFWIWLLLLAFAIVAAFMLHNLPRIFLWMRFPFMTRFEFNEEFRQDYWNYYVPVLPWNPIYSIPESHERFGDRSDRYVSLRKEVDAQLDDPVVFAKQLSVLKAEKEQTETVSTFDSSYDPPTATTPTYDSYDRLNCPDEPLRGYPFVWKTLDLIKAWNPNNTTVPTKIHSSLCVFDFTREYHKAMKYKAAQLPFIVANDPSVIKTAVRWSLPHYLKRLMGKDAKYGVSVSQTARFLYFNEKKWKKQHKKAHKLKGTAASEDPEPPTKYLPFTYDEFERHAQSASLPNQTHWYLESETCGSSANDGSCLEPIQGRVEFYFDELPFFQPHVKQPSNELYQYVDRKKDGIICRFGQEGIIYEAHYDGSPNVLVVLKGSRRFILSPPSACSKLALYPHGHPSERHSAVDWTDPDLERYPEFAQSESLELVLNAGEALFLPSFWFHFIISLDFNAQCNHFSERNDAEVNEDIERCRHASKKT